MGKDNKQNKDNMAHARMLPGGFAWRLAHTGINPDVAAVALDMFEEDPTDEERVLEYIHGCGGAEIAHAIRLGLSPRISAKHVDGDLVVTRSWV